MKETSRISFHTLQMHYERGNPQCFLDGLFEQQQKCEANDSEFHLTDGDIFGINRNMIFAGLPISHTKHFKVNLPLRATKKYRET